MGAVTRVKNQALFDVSLLPLSDRDGQLEKLAISKGMDALLAEFRKMVNDAVRVQKTQPKTGPKA